MTNSAYKAERIPACNSPFTLFRQYFYPLSPPQQWPQVYARQKSMSDGPDAARNSRAAPLHSFVERYLYRVLGAVTNILYGNGLAGVLV